MSDPWALEGNLAEFRVSAHEEVTEMARDVERVVVRQGNVVGDVFDFSQRYFSARDLLGRLRTRSTFRDIPGARTGFRA